MNTAYHAEQSPRQVDLIDFDVLYYKYHHAVYANILKIVNQHEAAEDILQEVFIAMWENRQKLHADKVAGWLFVTSFNKALKHLKKKKKEQSISLEEASLTIENFQEETLSEEAFNFQLSMVEDAVNHLSSRKKDVFRLCRYEGKSYDEVATILGISVNSVKDYLKQSTRFIKDYISDKYTETVFVIGPLLLIYLH